MDKNVVLAECKEFSRNTLAETLGIEFIDFGKDYLTARMPVNSKVHQPHGVLHGGAAAALAETVGSYASFVFVNDKNAMIRGVDITANHIKSISEGYIYAKATKVHFGRTLQIWEIRITDELGTLISYAKHTTIALTSN